MNASGTRYSQSLRHCCGEVTGLMAFWVSAGFTLWLACSACVDSYAAADDASRRFEGRTVRVSCDSWPLLIDQLHRQLGVSIVAHRPPARLKGVLSGDAGAVLRQLAQGSKGRWILHGDALCFAPDYLARAATGEPWRASGSDGGASASKPRDLMQELDNWVLRFCGFLRQEPGLLAEFASGSWTPIGELPPQMRSMARQLGAEDRGAMGRLWDQHHEKVEVTCSVAAGAMMFRQGQLMYGGGEGPPLGTTPPDTYRDGPGPSWPDLDTRAALFGDRSGISTSLSETKELRLGELPNAFFPELTICRRLADERVTVSAGEWRTAALLVLLQASTDTEVRRVERILFLGKSPLRREVERKLPMITRCCLVWDGLSRVVAPLAKSPLSSVDDSARAFLLRPALLTYSELPTALAEFVRRVGWPAVPSGKGEGDPEVQCWIHPVVRCHFRAPGGPDNRRVQMGAGPEVNYPWLALRRAAGEEQAVR